MTTTPLAAPTQRQIMLSLAYLAYCGSKMTTASPEATILGYINAAMPQIPPIASPNSTWQVVWGPGVYTTPGALYQDNMMFVAQNQVDETQFAIAIRGTNADLDWLLEDLDVLQTMIWPPGATTSSPAGAMISESTSIGMQILLAMQGATNSGQRTLMAFLTAQTASPINVCVTGHSLGGCLAGTLALYLKEQQASWDSSGKSTVSAITFAAPTAGNTAFATYSDSQFAGAAAPPNWDPSLGTSFDAVRCTYDIAPQAWIAANISQSATSSPLFQTYGSNIDFSSLPFPWGAAWSEVERYVLPGVAGLVTSQAYGQVVNSAAQLPGTFNGAPPPTSGASLTSFLEAFVTQARYQHGSSYPNLLGVTALLDPSIIVTAPPSST